MSIVRLPEYEAEFESEVFEIYAASYSGRRTILI